MKTNPSNVTVILQGLSVSKQSLNLIVESYLLSGYKDIIVSSYSWCVDQEYLEKKVQLILNDNFFYENEPIHEKIVSYIDNEVEKKIKKKRLNINYQIYTTLVAIEKALVLFPNNEYVIKQRCDMILLNIEDCIHYNLEKLRKFYRSEDKFFTTPFFDSIIRTPPHYHEWYYTDWFYLTSIDNLKKLFDIPLVTNYNNKPETYIIETYIRKLDREITWEKFLKKFVIPWKIYPNLYWFKIGGLISDNSIYIPGKHKHLISK